MSPTADTRTGRKAYADCRRDCRNTGINIHCNPQIGMRDNVILQFNQKIIPAKAMFGIRVFVGIPDGIAKQQMAFALQIHEHLLDGRMSMASLVNASVIQVFKIRGSMKIEEVRTRVMYVAFRHPEFQWQEMRHHDLGLL